jgi:VWFA-related protein
MLTHMRLRAHLAVFLLLPLISSAVVSAQQETPPPANGRISLDVVVTPKTGRPVAGLQQSDFSIIDNKVQQPIISFRAVSGSQEPVEMILLIDAVNTTYERIAYERDQINSFLRANGGHLAHPMGLAIFSDTGTTIQNNLSTDGNAIADSLSQQTVALRSLTRSAGFYGAVERFDLSMRTLEQLAENEAKRPGRKFILWVSPGWPLLSGPNTQVSNKQQQQLFSAVTYLTNRLREARVTLYNINPLGTEAPIGTTFFYQQFVKGITKPSQVQVGNLGLQVIATQSGGLVLNASNDLTSLLQECVADADAWYELSFDPPPGEPNEYHHLEVRVAKPGLIARTRQGYYSQPSH